MRAAQIIFSLSHIQNVMARLSHFSNCKYTSGTCSFLLGSNPALDPISSDWRVRLFIMQGKCSNITIRNIRQCRKPNQIVLSILMTSIQKSIKPCITLQKKSILGYLSPSLEFLWRIHMPCECLKGNYQLKNRIY